MFRSARALEVFRQIPVRFDPLDGPNECTPGEIRFPL